MVDGQGPPPGRSSPRTAGTNEVQRTSEFDLEVVAYLAEAQQLESPRGRTLPWRLRAFLPRPWESHEQLERLRHADVIWLSPQQVRHELAQLTQALAWVDDAIDVPPWVWARREVLRERLRLSVRAA